MCKVAAVTQNVVSFNDAILTDKLRGVAGYKKIKKINVKGKGCDFFSFCSDSSGGTEEIPINIYFNFTVTNKCNRNQYNVVTISLI